MRLLAVWLLRRKRRGRWAVPEVPEHVEHVLGTGPPALEHELVSDHDDPLGRQAHADARVVERSAGTKLLHQAEALAKPNRQGFDGQLALGHGEGRLHEFVRRRHELVTV